MPTYHTQLQLTWRDHFTERELRLIANCCQYAANDPTGLPGHQLMLIIARLTELLADFFDEKWRQGKLSELWSEEDEAGLLQLLGPYLGK